MDSENETGSIGTRYITWKASGVNSTTAQVVLFSVPTPMDDYNVRLDLDPTTFNYSTCSAGGANIRFYDRENASLPYWIESWNPAGNSTVWIKVPDAGTTWIAMDRGPFSLPAASNGDATFPFFDDFSGSTVDPSKWIVYEDTYGHVSVSNSTANITVATPDNTMHNAELGFTNDYAVSGAAFGDRNDDGVVFSTNYTSTYKDYAQVPHKVEAYECDFYKQWTSMDFAWINTSLVRFSKNDVLASTHTNASTFPTGTLPLRFVVLGCYWGPGTWWNAYISSVNATMGRPGMAMRAKTYAEFYVRSDPAVILVDWVFTRKCSAIEPATFIDKTPPGLGVSCELAISLYAGTTSSITWSISDISAGSFTISRNGATLLASSFDRQSSITTGIDTTSPGISTYAIHCTDISGNSASLAVVVTIIGGTDNAFIIIFIIILGAVIGIVAPVGYTKRKSRGRQEARGKKDKMLGHYVASPRGASNTTDANEKRDRMLRLPSIDFSKPPVLDGPVTPKKSTISENVVDIGAREASAKTMAREVTVQEASTKCIVHKGPVTGFGYTCPSCGVHYCVPCVQHVAAKEGKCWNCNARIDVSGPGINGNAIATPLPTVLPKDEVGLLSRDVWEKIRVLEAEGWITPDIIPEVLAEIKSLPPGNRMTFLDEFKVSTKSALLQQDNDMIDDNNNTN